ncbi:MAG: signal peptidase I [Victivallaceae bacterium]
MKKKIIFTKSRIAIILLLLLALGLHLQPYRLGIVAGESMSPTLKNGQLLLIYRDYYQSHPIEHGDIISCRVNGKTLVKRVYALPGEEVIQLHSDNDGSNDMIIKPYMIEKAFRLFVEKQVDFRIIRVEVEPGSVYLLGDGGMLSTDSRDFGPIEQKRIIGKVIQIFEDKVEADANVLAAVL